MEEEEEESLAVKFFVEEDFAMAFHARSERASKPTQRPLPALFPRAGAVTLASERA